MPEEYEVVTSAGVSCDGGGPLGHPKVYLMMGKDGKIVCPYCSRRYVLAEDAGQTPGH